MSFSPIKTSRSAAVLGNGSEGQGKWVKPKFNVSTFSEKSYVPQVNMPDYYGIERQRRNFNFRRSRSDIHLPSKVGKKNKHIYAKNILVSHKMSTGNRKESDIHLRHSTTKSFDKTVYPPPGPTVSDTHIIPRPRANDLRNSFLRDSHFAYSSDRYYENFRAKSPTSEIEKSCYHNVACREPKRAFFKQDYNASIHSDVNNRGLRNFDHHGFGELYASKYDRKYELSCPDVIYMKSIDRNPNFKPKRWNKDDTKSFPLPKNEELQTNEYAGKMWMMGNMGNNLSRSDGIDMSLGIIRTKKDLNELKKTRKQMKRISQIG